MYKYTSVQVRTRGMAQERTSWLVVTAFFTWDAIYSLGIPIDPSILWYICELHVLVHNYGKGRFDIEGEVAVSPVTSTM